MIVKLTVVATPVTFAVTVFVPAVAPTENDVGATPLASVSDVVGATTPFPAVTAQFTVTPGTPRPLASVTVTLSGGDSSVATPAVWLVGTAAEMSAAAPGPSGPVAPPQAVMTAAAASRPSRTGACMCIRNPREEPTTEGIWGNSIQQFYPVRGSRSTPAARFAEARRAASASRAAPQKMASGAGANLGECAAVTAPPGSRAPMRRKHPSIRSR